MKRSRTLGVTPEHPSFRVRYIGRRETFTARGKGCTQSIMQDMWDLSVAEQRLKRVVVSISLSGIEINSLENSDSTPMERIPMSAITYCSLDKSINKRIFSWIYVDDSGLEEETALTPKLWCAAIVADTPQKARSIAAILSRSFNVAYNDFHCTKRLVVRKLTSGKLASRASSITSQTSPSGLHFTSEEELSLISFVGAAGDCNEENEKLNEVSEITLETAIVNDESHYAAAYMENVKSNGS